MKNDSYVDSIPAFHRIIAILAPFFLCPLI